MAAGSATPASLSNPVQSIRRARSGSTRRNPFLFGFVDPEARAQDQVADLARIRRGRKLSESDGFTDLRVRVLEPALTGVGQLEEMVLVTFEDESNGCGAERARPRVRRGADEEGEKTRQARLRMLDTLDQHLPHLELTLHDRVGDVQLGTELAVAQSGLRLAHLGGDARDRCRRVPMLGELLSSGEKDALPGRRFLIRSGTHLCTLPAGSGSLLQLRVCGSGHHG